MYPTDILDQRPFKNLKPNIFYPFVEPDSHVSGSTKNIITDQSIASYYLLPNPEDQI